MPDTAADKDIYGKVVSWCTRSDVSPLRYPGGKRKLAPLIADLILKADAKIELFVEPFAGGAAVSISLLENGLVGSIGIADIDPLVAGFWQTVFSKNAQGLADRIRSADVTLAEWRHQKTLQPANVADAAYKCLFLNRTSFSGALMNRTGPIGGATQAGEYKIDCRFNRDRLADRVLELSLLRDRVRFVKNESYREVMKSVRRSAPFRRSEFSVLWYMDPPFFAKADRLYRFSFNAAAHARLASDAPRIPGHWILSYDDHADARHLYGEHRGFARINLQYSARIDDLKRLVASEVIVSDLISDLREAGKLHGMGDVIQLPRRRQKMPATLSTSAMFAAL